MSRSSSRPSRRSRKVPILGGIALLGLVLTAAFLAGTKSLAAQTEPSPSSQTRERQQLPDEQVPFVVIGVLALTIIPVVLGIKAAKRKGVSPHWMWFGLHPLGGWIAYLVIRSRPDRVPAPLPRTGHADRIVPAERPGAPAESDRPGREGRRESRPGPPGDASGQSRGPAG